MLKNGFVPYAALLKVVILSVSFAWFFGSHSVMADDTGDAAESYGQASHTVVIDGAYLGFQAPDDNVAQSDEMALGDDNDSVDDEDGIFAFPVLVQNGKTYDVNVFASNPSSVDAVLFGWIDFDGNGTFDEDEAANATVAAGTDNGKFKLIWPDLSGISSAYLGTTYVRFRISSDPLSAASSQGAVSNGEVEDYAIEVLLDSDGDDRPDVTDLDNDNDGIPDSVEGQTADTDGDGTPDYLDVDSDADFVPDYVEAGQNPHMPTDSDSDGVADYLDEDSNNDGVPDSEPVDGDADRDSIPDSLEGDVDTDGDGVLDRNDIDSDNDTIPDAIEAGMESGMARDTDSDGIPDYLDGDSDNDGVSDIREANAGELDVKVLDADNDGRVDSQWIIGVNGLVDRAESAPDSGIPLYSIADVDRDGTPDFRELDSDGDGVSDLLEGGGVDSDGDSQVDGTVDSDGDGVIEADNLALINGGFPDVDDDGIPDFQDEDADGSSIPSGDSEGAPGDQSGSEIKTGLSGGAGCSVDSGNGSNGFLFMLMLFSAGVVCRRSSRFY